MVTRNQLVDWIDTRFGYGNPSASLWFLGLEESMDRGLSDFERRVDVWDQRGRPDWDSVRGYHEDLPDPVYLPAPNNPTRPRKRQQTWGYLAKILSTFRGVPAPSNPNFAHWTDPSFGAKGADHALAELMPLPKKKADTLPDFYPPLGQNLGIVGLANNVTYTARYARPRMSRLLAQLPKGRVAVVVYAVARARVAILDAFQTASRLPHALPGRAALRGLKLAHAWGVSGDLAICISSFAGNGQMTTPQALEIGRQARAWVSVGTRPPVGVQQYPKAPSKSP